MTPRYAADIRAIVWMFLATSLVAVQVIFPGLAPYLCAVSAYFALAAGILAHNHNHCPTFRHKGLNEAWAIWLSIFYGYPTFAWIPTHNLNHHKFTNAEGDATITWRHTNRHTAWVAATYFFVSSYYQGGPIQQFIRKAKARNGKMYKRIVRQYVSWAGIHLAVVATCIYLHGFGTGLLTWTLCMGIPSFFSLWTIMLFNYEQHVHADPFSEYDHSRNFVSPIMNYLLFNNGYHTVHHDYPGTHWSKLPALHAKIADKIHPDLKEPSLLWYWFRQYALVPVGIATGTKQIGPEPGGITPPMRTADVDVAVSGTNSERVRTASA
ncbi:MAG: fatty acid desaturase [Myxococcota bacterium]|nr:fatty acid desaturase [Myxococcota bacterium]